DAEHMVLHRADAGALQRPEVAHVLDHDQDAAVAARIGADAAGRARIDIAADLAHPHRLDRTIERRGQRDHQLVLFLDELQHRAPRRARPEAGQAREELDQLLDFGSGGHQNGSFIPGGSCKPCVSSAIFCCIICSALVLASLCAVTIRSSSTVTSSSLNSEGSIFSPCISPLPLRVTLTRPPPERPSTVARPASSCSSAILRCISSAFFIMPRKSTITRPHALPGIRLHRLRRGSSRVQISLSPSSPETSP